MYPEHYVIWNSNRDRFLSLTTMNVDGIGPVYEVFWRDVERAYVFDLHGYDFLLECIIGARDGDPMKMNPSPVNLAVVETLGMYPIDEGEYWAVPYHTSPRFNLAFRFFN